MIILGFVFLFFAVIFASKSIKPKQAGIQIETTPDAIVFIDGLQVGKTPYNTSLKPGEITLKLVPIENTRSLVAFESRVLLSNGIRTVVKRSFADSESLSSGEIISFERTGESGTSLAIVSDPDSAQISIDGTPRGFAPYKTASINKGSHQIVVSSPGFIERAMSVNTLTGYKLTAIVKLALDEAAVVPSPSPLGQASPSPTPEPQYVEILETPNGFLRVREEPNTEAKEVARVTSGKKYLMLEQDPKTKWYKIEYETGKSGWVSDEFATVSKNPN